MWCEVWIEVHFLFFWYLDISNTIVLGLFIKNTIPTELPLHLCQKSIDHLQVRLLFYSILFHSFYLSLQYFYRVEQLYNKSRNRQSLCIKCSSSNMFWLHQVIFIFILILETVCQFLQKLCWSLDLDPNEPVEQFGGELTSKQY